MMRGTDDSQQNINPNPMWQHLAAMFPASTSGCTPNPSSLPPASSPLTDVQLQQLGCAPLSLDPFKPAVQFVQVNDLPFQQSPGRAMQICMQVKVVYCCVHACARGMPPQSSCQMLHVPHQNRIQIYNVRYTLDTAPTLSGTGGELVQTAEQVPARSPCRPRAAGAGHACHAVTL